MSDVTAELMLEQFRAIRADLAKQRELLELMLLRTGAHEQHMAAFQTGEVHQNIELDRLRARVERIERRLELVQE